jgi:sec-independent protein translocase protein TatA
MPSIGPMELIVILVIALFVVGPKRLPEAGRSLGEGLRGFRTSLSGADPVAHAPQATSPEAGTRAARQDEAGGEAEGSSLRPPPVKVSAVDAQAN